jgi:hypothetical protein
MLGRNPVDKYSWASDTCLISYTKDKRWGSSSLYLKKNLCGLSERDLLTAKISATVATQITNISSSKWSKDPTETTNDSLIKIMLKTIIIDAEYLQDC